MMITTESSQDEEGDTQQEMSQEYVQHQKKSKHVRLASAEQQMTNDSVVPYSDEDYSEDQKLEMRDLTYHHN